MVFPRGEHFVERPNGRGRMRGQVGVEIELEVLREDQEAVHAIQHRFVQAGDCHLDDLRTLRRHLAQCRAHDRRDLGIGRVRPEQGREQADAGASAAGGLQESV
jgi:hypothetical protein